MRALLLLAVLAGCTDFDDVARNVSGGQSSTLALTGSTEEAQFEPDANGATTAV